MLVATLGGLLGILLMLPLRARAHRREARGSCKSPEGSGSCAEVLKAGAAVEADDVGGRHGRGETAGRCRGRGRFAGYHQGDPRNGQLPWGLVLLLGGHRRRSSSR